MVSQHHLIAEMCNCVSRLWFCYKDSVWDDEAALCELFSRVYTVTGQRPDEQTLESIIATGESETYLQEAIQVQGRGQITETIREIHDRHDAVNDIQKNLLELHQIFMDMAVLVEAQGEQLNNIEQQVNKASSFVQRGTGQLEIAKRHQRNKRKCMCICVILLIILILIILLPILVATHVIWGYAVSNHIGTHCNGPCRDSLPCTLPMYIVCLQMWCPVEETILGFSRCMQWNPFIDSALQGKDIGMHPETG